MIRLILTDIEGTTTPITFVHDVLFPYSSARLPSFVASSEDDPAVQQCLADTIATVREEKGKVLDTDGAVEQLLRWIEEDRKHPALKTIQGLIWRHGYESGAYKGAVYDDVKPALERWKKAGRELGVYSSGSVAAQKLLFAHSSAGDLSPLFSCYFDTAVGGKREPAAYANILKEVRRSGGEVLFLSDVAAELDAAAQVGVETIQLVRPGITATDRHRTAPDFDAVEAMALR